MSSIESFTAMFLESGERDLSELELDEREAIIREHFKDAPFIIAFAMDVAGIHYVSDLDDIERDATESFQGEYDDLADFAAHFVEEVYSEYLEALPDFIRYNIDYAAIGRDMDLGGEIHVVDTNLYEYNSNGVYIFNATW